MLTNRQPEEFFNLIPNASETNSNLIRIMAIEGMTGLSGLISAFDNMDGITEVEALVIFLNKKYELSDGDYDILNYITNTLGFSTIALKNIHADNDEFYYNMTTIEAIGIILTKIIDHSRNFRLDK